MGQTAPPGRDPAAAGREALARLREGNRRFAAGALRRDSSMSHAQRAELAAKQEPFAVILGCSDSRVPAEIVFDQGLGDLFVIRIAGNIVSDSQIGSVEFAVGQLGTRLVLVLGHSRCGAVLATLEELRQPATERSPNVQSIVERIRPAVEPLLREHPGRAPEELLREAVRANVGQSVTQLRCGSELVARLLESGELLLIGAEYSLETGVVDVFVDSEDER